MPVQELQEWRRTLARHFTRKELVSITGAKESQIENWTRYRLLSPPVANPGSGIDRQYDAVDVIVTLVLVQLAALRVPSPVMLTIANEIVPRIKARRDPRLALEESDVWHVAWAGAPYMELTVRAGKMLARLEQDPVWNREREDSNGEAEA